ncbi:MAG: hypothetical protein KC619_14215 [Myxococcales bacterium]|nr:hypothetical protein [Myxococcales bacterium]
MRRAILLTVLVAASGCSLIVGPGNKYLDGSTALDGGPPPDGALPDGSLPDGSLPDGASPDGGATDPLPPVGSGVGLSDYAPVPTQTLEVIVGPYRDPNGDPVTAQIQWTLDGADIAGQTSTRLDLGAVAATVGAEIGVRVTLSDGMLSTELRAGPATVQADDALRWRMLFPPRGQYASGSVGVFDSRRQRLLFHSLSESDGPHGLWEYQLAQSGSPSRWVRLEHVSGDERANAGSVIEDPARDRILFFGGRGGGATAPLTALVLGDVQGSERWATIPPDGEAPSPRSAETRIRFDLPSGEEVVFIYGGQETDDVWLGDAYLLHVEDGDRWERLTVPMPSTRLVGVPFFHAPTNRLFIAGGVAIGDPPTAFDEVWVWDLDDAYEAGFTFAGGLTLPHAIFGGAATVDGDVAYLFGGLQELGPSGGGTLNGDVISIDLSTMAVTSRPSSGQPQVPLTLSAGGGAFRDDQVVYVRDFDGAGLHFYSVDAVNALWTPISAEGQDVPPPLMQAQAIYDNRGMVISGGRTSVDDQEGSDVLYGFEDHRFTPVATTGEGPGVRWGVVSDGAWEGTQNLHWLLGGHPSSMPIALSDLRLLGGGARWQHSSVAIGESIPEEREGHVLFRGVCRGLEGGVDRGNHVGIFGGRLRGSGSISNEIAMMRCDVGMEPPNDCRFFDNHSDTRPGAAWAAVTQLSAPGAGDLRYAFIQGGLTGSGLTNRAWIYDTCNDDSFLSSWPEAALAGARPPAMLGHSLTAAHDDMGHQTLAYLLFGAEDENGGSAYGAVFRMDWNQDNFNPELTFARVVPAAGENPVPRAFHVAAYDPTENRILVYGGLSDGRLLDDLWELRLR